MIGQQYGDRNLFTAPAPDAPKTLAVLRYALCNTSFYCHADEKTSVLSPQPKWRPSWTFSNLYLSQYAFSRDLMPSITLLLNGDGTKPAIAILALHFPATSYLQGNSKVFLRWCINIGVCNVRETRTHGRVLLRITFPHGQDLHKLRC